MTFRGGGLRSGRLRIMKWFKRPFELETYVPPG